MRNGYALTTSEGLDQINRQLAAIDHREREQLMGQLKVGIQRQTEVTLPHEGAVPLLVSQGLRLGAARGLLRAVSRTVGALGSVGAGSILRGHLRSGGSQPAAEWQQQALPNSARRRCLRQSNRLDPTRHPPRDGPLSARRAWRWQLSATVALILRCRGWSASCARGRSTLLILILEKSREPVDETTLRRVLREELQSSR